MTEKKRKGLLRRRKGIRFIANVRVGDPDVSPSLPAHTPGVGEGNARGRYEAMEGHRGDDTSTARRSTGIDPESRNPIHPDMPNLSPP